MNLQPGLNSSFEVNFEVNFRLTFCVFWIIFSSLDFLPFPNEPNNLTSDLLEQGMRRGFPGFACAISHLTAKPRRLLKLCTQCVLYPGFAPFLLPAMEPTRNGGRKNSFEINKKN